jgi:hypothetical protein
MTPTPDDAEVRDAYPAVDRAFAAGWDDPRMDDYDRYEAQRCAACTSTRDCTGETGSAR